MTSRRALIVGGAAIATGGAVAASGRADDALRALGVRPATRRRPGEDALVTAVRADSERLLAAAAQAPEPIRQAVAAHVEAVGGDPAKVAPAPAADLLAAFADAVAVRRTQALAAESRELVQTLASMTAGLAVLVEELR